MSRAFNATEKRALYVEAGGKCSRCGCELPENWHGDHIKPWSKGGATDVVNGQALCPTCNLKKGGKMRELREPQKELIEMALAHDGNRFLGMLPTGVGKTLAGVIFAHEMMERGRVDRVAVVGPMNETEGNWQRCFHDEFEHLLLDIEQKKDKSYKGESTDEIGIVTTYAAIAKAPDYYRTIKSEKRTLWILDEIHHCADARKWGDEVAYVVKDAAFVLALSATPWPSLRSSFLAVFSDHYKQIDEDTIEIQPDYEYTIREATAKHYIKPIAFTTIDADIGFDLRDLQTDELISHEFKLSDSDSVNRSRALGRAFKIPTMEDVRQRSDEAEQTYMVKGIREMRKALEFTKTQIPDAGAVLMVRSIEHAGYIEPIVDYITGSKSVVVHSEMSNAQEVIQKFRDGKGDYLISVDMIAESVDISRLCVELWATPVSTRLGIVQRWGRVVRMRDEDPKTCSATILIPAEGVIRAYAKEWEDMIKEIWKEEGPEGPPAPERRFDMENSRISGAAEYSVIRQGIEMQINRADIEIAEQFSVSVELIQAIRNSMEAPDREEEESQQQKVLNPREKEILKKKLNKTAASIASGFYRKTVNSFDSKWFEKSMELIHITANDIVGIESQKATNVTFAQLEEKERLLEEWKRDMPCDLRDRLLDAIK